MTKLHLCVCLCVCVCSVCCHGGLLTHTLSFLSITCLLCCNWTTTPLPLTLKTTTNNFTRYVIDTHTHVSCLQLAEVVSERVNRATVRESTRLCRGRWLCAVNSRSDRLTDIVRPDIDLLKLINACMSAKTNVGLSVNCSKLSFTILMLKKHALLHDWTLQD